MTRRLGIHVWRVFIRPLGLSLQTQPAAIEVRFITPADGDGLWTEGVLDLTAAKASAAFARGDVCIGAFDGGCLVAYAWLASQPAPHVDGLWMAFDPRAIYIYRAFVRPEYRGRRIAPALYSFADTVFLSQGKKYAVICVSIYNRASIAAAQRSGALTAGYTAYWSAGSWFVAMHSAGAKRCGFRFYRP